MIRMRSCWPAVLLLCCACQAEPDAEPGTTPGAQNNTTGTAANHTTSPPVELPPFEPSATKMRRLSQVEYHNTIHDIFGQFVVIPDLEPDTPVNGFTSIGNAQISTSRLGVEKYETAARSIASQVLRNPARNNLLDCRPQSFVDGPCATNFIENVGPRIFRRPLTAVEIQTYSTVATLGARDLRDFWLGLEFGLAALLQSPNFLYRVEFGEPDEDTGWRRLTGYEVASRLSYFIWASTPDEMLLSAAAEGRLDTADGISAEVDRMLENPRSVRGLRTLWDEFLQLRGLATKVKDPNLFPEFDAALAADMREETLRVVEHYMHRNVDFREIFSTNKTFVNRRLAAIYDLDVETDDDEFVEIELPADDIRRGVLGHASFLAGHAHAAHTSPTHRGLFVRQSLLCLPIPPPPPNIDTTIEAAAPGQTLREKLSVHMENDGCSGCHRLMDPIGFGFENFDALGRYRTEDNGAPVDATGDLDGANFEHAGELSGLVATHDALSSCIVRKVYRHALGHVESHEEEVLIDTLEADWAADGYPFRDLLEAIVTSDGFLYVKGDQ